MSIYLFMDMSELNERTVQYDGLSGGQIWGRKSIKCNQFEKLSFSFELFRLEHFRTLATRSYRTSFVVYRILSVNSSDKCTKCTKCNEQEWMGWKGNCLFVRPFHFVSRLTFLKNRVLFRPHFVTSAFFSNSRPEWIVNSSSLSNYEANWTIQIVVFRTLRSKVTRNALLFQSTGSNYFLTN